MAAFTFSHRDLPLGSQWVLARLALEGAPEMSTRPPTNTLLAWRAP